MDEKRASILSDTAVGASSAAPDGPSTWTDEEPGPAPGEAATATLSVISWPLPTWPAACSSVAARSSRRRCLSRDFPFDVIHYAPGPYPFHDTQVLHPISMTLVISLGLFSQQNLSICPKIPHPRPHHRPAAKARGEGTIPQPRACLRRSSRAAHHRRPAAARCSGVVQQFSATAQSFLPGGHRSSTSATPESPASEGGKGVAALFRPPVGHTPSPLCPGCPPLRRRTTVPRLFGDLHLLDSEQHPTLQPSRSLLAVDHVHPPIHRSHQTHLTPISQSRLVYDTRNWLKQGVLDASIT